MTEPSSTVPAAPTILCVDDEPNILSSLRRLFRTKGYAVKTADSGQAGLQILEQEHIDLVISDMRMPEMDGAKFLEHVRARWPETVRLLLTGYADVASIIDAINRGEIYRYITKPWDDNDIVLLVQHALERKALEQEKARLEALTQSQNEALKSLNTSLEAKVEARTAELKATFVTSIKVFSSLIEMRGGGLAGHSRRVADMSRKIALKMELDNKLVQEIFVAGLLHEIGKVGFSDELLSTTVATMNPKQLDQYRKHPGMAEQLLLPLQELRSTAAMIGAQLERYDGTGHPQQLLEQAIPVGARVLALASDYDNFQIGAFAQRNLSADDIKTLIQHGSGKRYDPQVVTAFMAVLSGSDDAGKLGVGEIAIAVKDLVVGMVLSRDLIAPNGFLMLSAQHALDARLIQRLLDFERLGSTQLIVHVRQERGK
jgi:response regulator RpfG family c-di-GMP phosphodiesterase